MSVATRRRSSALTHDITYQPDTDTDEYPKFTLPRTDTTNQTPNPLHPYTQLLPQHLTFRQTAEPWHRAADLHTLSLADLHAISLAFPHLRDAATVLCAAAWFAVLCAVDDLVEPLGADAATSALSESSRLLSPETSLGSPSPSSFPAEEEWQAVDAGARVRRITTALRAHAQALLPPRAYAAFAAGVCRTWGGIVEETRFRRAARLPSVDAYLAIRVRTVGLAPFVALLEGAAGVCNNNNSCSKSEALRGLERELEVAVGLQNDVVGLDKDVREGEAMNFVVVAAGGLPVPGKGQGVDGAVLGMRDGVARAVAWHNHAVERARRCWAEVVVAGGEGEREVAGALWRFIATHYAWASAAKRYRA